ncbi:ABC transporter permease subunit [Neobacillus sp. YIM B06451]|uniref:ABC transporter permease n=1 Tax=Neobacillus sp. YIM B06451 TaxID=3070994 RepID=UPI00292CC4D7|nr:ABC transporter permease subunit [Neobacillus sp. YIM B06451]
MSLLIKNEIGKIFGKKSSWIYMVIILIAVVLGGILQKNFTEEPSKNWREETQARVNQLEQDLKTAPEEEKEWMMADLQQQQKYLDENINPNAMSNWHFMNQTVYGITTLVTLFAVIVSSAIVSSEFSDGTIKQLLIRPHERWAILLSKYLSAVIYSLLLVIVLIVSGYIAGSLIFGTGEFTAKFFEFTLEGGRKIAEIGPQFFLKVLYYLPSLLVFITISFMLSTLFKSQALAVGIGIFVLFLSSTLGGLIVMLAEKYTWAKFLIFPHMDLTVYALQDKILEDVTLPISLLTLSVYYVIFMLLTFTIFQKRDVSI